MTVLDVAPTHDTSASNGTRIRFFQPVSTDGFVDAVWWPRSDDLQTELPGLLDVLWTAGRDIVRVTYNVDHWRPAPRRVVVAGRSIRLGSFHTQDPLLFTAIDARNTDRIDILVVPPDADPTVGEHLLDLTEEADNIDRPAVLWDRAVSLAGDGG